MSAIYFHTPSRTVNVSGRERAWMGVLTTDLGMAPLRSRWSFGLEETVKPLLPEDCYLHRMSGRDFPEAFWTWLRVGSDSYVDVPMDGEKTRLNTWVLTLNTAMILGGDSIRLFARIHAQCEMHGWVSGANKRWLAESIAKGLEEKVFRPDQGWDDVMELLAENDSEPAVMSYSVCEQFPNANYVPEDHPAMEAVEADPDAFYDLPKDEQWSACMQGLSSMDRSPELRPDKWNDYLFEHRMTWLDVLSALDEKVPV